MKQLLKLSWKQIWSKPLSALLSLVLLAVAVAIISLLLMLNQQFQQQFRDNVRGVDMVIGAKGSPLQLILSSMYHIDAPTGNISLEESQRILKNPLITEHVPLAYGDSYKGHRLVGTDSSFIKLYDLKLTEGQMWKDEFEVVLGHTVAQRLGLKVGDAFFSAHGLQDDTHVHEDHPYTIMGILEPSGTVADQLILCSVESVWHIHEHDDVDAPKELTAVLVKFRSPLGLVQIPRMINEQTSMMAALPSIEVNRLFDLFGRGIQVLRLLAVVIMVISAFSVFVSLFQSLKEQRYELALLRTMGASRSFLFALIILQGIFLTVLGYILGIVLSRLGLWIVGNFVENTYQYKLSGFFLLKEELWLFPLIVGLGILSALIPAFRAYRTPISETLRES